MDCRQRRHHRLGLARSVSSPRYCLRDSGAWHRWSASRCWSSPFCVSCGVCFI